MKAVMLTFTLTLGLVIVVFIGCALWDNAFYKPPELIVFFQGWVDNKSFVYAYRTLTIPPITTGKDLDDMVRFLERANGFKQVIPISFQRYERR